MLSLLLMLAHGVVIFCQVTIYEAPFPNGPVVVSNPFFSDDCPPNDTVCPYNDSSVFPVDIPANSTWVPRFQGTILPEFNGTFFTTNSPPDYSSFSWCLLESGHPQLVPRSNRCWSYLKLDLWTKWKYSESSCGSTPFSRCVLEDVGFPESDCSSIKPGTCSAPSTASFRSPSEYYITYNIYGT